MLIVNAQPQINILKEIEIKIRGKMCILLEYYYLYYIVRSKEFAKTNIPPIKRLKNTNMSYPQEGIRMIQKYMQMYSTSLIITETQTINKGLRDLINIKTLTTLPAVANSTGKWTYS